jgi:8-oxo-dGTP pyrophosphatase MutT (NUDIX family)
VGVAALREVQEEAGVKGELGRCLGFFEVRFQVISICKSVSQEGCLLERNDKARDFREVVLCLPKAAKSNMITGDHFEK